MREGIFNEMRGFSIFLKVLCTIIISSYCFSAVSARPSVPRKADSLLLQADDLRKAYRFDESLEVLKDAMESVQDSSGTSLDSAFTALASDRILLAENGRAMSGFVDNPVVVARHRFSVSDFFLYYPFRDSSWRSVPNQLDSAAGHPYSKALYAPDGADVIYYSAVDSEGIRNICMTEKKDTVWTTPALINEQMTSASDEIYPVLSPDGKTMYFASAGLYGVGGYDLYASEWNEEGADWSAPVNLGFPYSSPADDFLYMNTPDGKFTIFASNRDCSKDSVYVYVLEYVSMPVRKAIEDSAELEQLSHLVPLGDSADRNKNVSAEIPENLDTRRYMDKMAQVRAIRDTLAVFESRLENDRNLYVMSSDADERILLTNRILATEAQIPAIQDSLGRASDELRKIEMEFLFNGVVIDPDTLMSAADREVVGDDADYTFERMNMGGPLQMDILPPPVVFDYTFKVLDEGQFALDNTLPQGVLYQIQIFTMGTQASVRNLRGLSPVFEQKTASGRYIYRVGVFRSYKDVLARVNTVKRLGFKSAFIVAFNDGKEVTVSKARSLEAKEKENPVLYQVLITPEAELDEAATSGIRQQASGKDIAKIENEAGHFTYIVGPYTDKSSAEALKTFVEAMRIGHVELKTVKEKAENL